MRLVARQTQVRHPSNVRVLFQPPGQLHRILAMLAHPQTQRLQTLQEKKGAKRIQTGSNLPEVLRPHPGCVRCSPKSLNELEPVIAFAGLCEARELS